MDGFAIGRYEDTNNDIVITHDGNTIIDELDTIIEEYNLSPDDVFSIMGKWDKKEKDYSFDDFMKAAQAVEELEGRIVMEKLTGE